MKIQSKKAPVERNIAQAVSKLKQELSQCSEYIWFGMIKIYNNSSVECYIDAPGLHDSEPTFHFGNTQEKSELLYSEQLQKEYFDNYHHKSLVDYIVSQMATYGR